MLRSRRGRHAGLVASAVAAVVAATMSASATVPTAADPALTYAGSHASTPRAAAVASSFASATPRGRCGPGSLPEQTQGRAPLADFSNGRALKGYTCNARLVSRIGDEGGYRTHIYTDTAGHTCAYYDGTNVYGQSVVYHQEYGTAVVDMTDRAHPVETTRLITQAFAMPHESMTISPDRGLLMAAAATNATGPAVVDIYSLKQDCRHPTLMSSTPFGILGHEGNVTADGKTFWVSANVEGVLAAIDISNPSLPSLAYFGVGQIVVHGFSLSPDGKTLYAARNGACLCTGSPGLEVWDVSQVQERKQDPQVTRLSSLTWPEVSVPQTTMPITVKGHRYVVEVDEYAGNVTNTPTDPVGGARVIDVQNPRHPFVLSDLRLQVDQPANRLGPQVNDPNANNQFVGYAAHYCSVPRTDDPLLVACSFLASGLRVFSIADPAHPVEVAYFNHPQDKPGDTSGSSAFSQPSWDLKRHAIWFSDSNHGFFDVQLTNGVWPAALSATTR